MSTDVTALHNLLKDTYFAGFNDGNRLDHGCRPEDFARFDEWWSGAGAGIVMSALAALAGAQGEEESQAAPRLEVGIQVPFHQATFVVRNITRQGSGVYADMQDLASYQRDFAISPEPTPTRATCDRTGCDLSPGHMGQHGAIASGPVF